jgi:hypothetical protein
MDNLISKEDAKALGAIATASAAAGSATVTVGTVTTAATVPAAGVWGWLGFTTVATTTTAVAVPVAGVVAVGGLLAYGAYKVVKALNGSDSK